MTKDWRSEIQQFLAFELRRIEIAQTEADYQQGVTAMYSAAFNAIQGYLVTELKRMSPEDSLTLTQMAELLGKHRPALCDYQIERQLKELDRLNQTAADGLVETERRLAVRIAEGLEALFTRMKRTMDREDFSAAQPYTPPAEKARPQAEKLVIDRSQIEDQVKNILKTSSGQQVHPLALVSLFALFFFSFVPFIGPIVSLVTARMAMNQIKAEPNRYTGYKVAQISLALSALALVGSFVVCCLSVLPFFTAIFSN